MIQKDRNEFSVSEVQTLLKKEKSDFWTKEQRNRSLDLFHRVSQRVPAYKDFLKKNAINPKKIKTWEDFQTVPPITKKNYLRVYPLEDLCWDGTLNSPAVFTSTSGSTGEPFYFMRQQKIDWQSSIIVEEFLKTRFHTKKEPMLVIICFGMGIWIGGLITYKGFEMAAIRNNYPVSIITPGINKKEVFNILRNLAPKYKQIVLVGYPPFIKDIIDECPQQDITLKNYDISLFFAAESISEAFREYIAKKVHIKNPYLDIINIYGSADIGTMATETTVSALIKSLTHRNKKLFSDLFSPINKTPTLGQYNPLFINFEEVNGEVLLTGDNYLPLVRYGIGDSGGVFSFNDVITKLKLHNINLADQIRRLGLQQYTNELPFVFVYERIDLSTTFYGMWVYPEWLRDSLIRNGIDAYATGKFTLMTSYNKNLSQCLEIHIEVKKGKTMTSVIKQHILQAMIQALRVNSSEYRELSDKLGKLSHPKLRFWPAEHPLYFMPGVKQKWAQNLTI